MEWLEPIWPISPQTLHYPSIYGGGIEHALSDSHHSPLAAAWSNASSSQTASHHGLLLPFPHHRRALPPPTPLRPDPSPPAQIHCHTAQSAAIRPSLGIPELLPPHPACRLLFPYPVLSNPDRLSRHTALIPLCGTAHGCHLFAWQTPVGRIN
jgi:hypothetical protein